MKEARDPLDTEDDIGSLGSPGSAIESAKRAARTEQIIANRIRNVPVLWLIDLPHVYAARPIARRAMKGDP